MEVRHRLPGVTPSAHSPRTRDPRPVRRLCSRSFGRWRPRLPTEPARWPPRGSATWPDATKPANASAPRCARYPQTGTTAAGPPPHCTYTTKRGLPAQPGRGTARTVAVRGHLQVADRAARRPDPLRPLTGRRQPAGWVNESANSARSVATPLRSRPATTARPSPSARSRPIYWAVSPPSTMCSWAVIYEDSSEARNRTRLATSSGSAIRANGTCEVMPPPSSSVAAAIIGVLM